MAKKKKKRVDNTKQEQMIVSIIVFVASMIMIVLFMFLAAEKFNEVELQPSNVIYNNPGKTRDEDIEMEGESEELDPESEDEELVPMEDVQEALDTVPDREVQGASVGWWSYPDVIYEIPVDEVRIDTVVDKGNRLSEYYVPEGLTSIGNLPGIGLSSVNLKLTAPVISALSELGEAASKDGVNDLYIVSAYRSYTDQKGAYQKWLDYNGGIADYADQVSARPGHSEHQLGTVVDFATTSTIGDFEAFESTQAYQWLLANARYYGFKQSYPAGMEHETGYSAESWHWRWWGE